MLVVAIYFLFPKYLHWSRSQHQAGAGVANLNRIWNFELERIELCFKVYMILSILFRETELVEPDDVSPWPANRYVDLLLFHDKRTVILAQSELDGQSRPVFDYSPTGLEDRGAPLHNGSLMTVFKKTSSPSTAAVSRAPVILYAVQATGTES